MKKAAFDVVFLYPKYKVYNIDLKLKWTICKLKYI